MSAVRPLITLTLLLVVFARPASATASSPSWSWILREASPDALRELDARLAAARARRQPVMLDFYADWCAACRLLDRGALSDAGVIDSLRGIVTIRVDVSVSDELATAIGERYRAHVLPTILLITPGGEHTQLSGTIGAKALRAALRKLR